MRNLYLLGTILLLATRPAVADPMPAMARNAPTDSPMMASMTTMNQAMANTRMTGNTDQDFVAMMIPHHQGAVDMARAELFGGKDPALRRLATSIIAAQAKEIGMMRHWQASHPR